MDAGEGQQPLAVEDLVLDPQRWEATLRGQPLRLTRTEFSLLRHMARDPGKVFTRDELLDAVWGANYTAASNVVDQAMTGLRRKLKDDPRHPTFIETATGVGYRLRARPPTRPGRSLPRTAGIALGAAVAIALAGLAIGLGLWVAGPDSTEGEGRRQVVTFHATARITDPGEVSHADCSDDMAISGVKSLSEVTGDLTGELRAVSTTRLYQDTDCLSGASRSRSVLTDERGDTLEFAGEAPVITYRLPDLPDTAVNHQSVSITVTGGTGKYAGVRGEGSCTTLSLSELRADELEASSESDCELTLRFPRNGETPAAEDEVGLELSASPVRLSIFGREQSVPSQGSFLAVVHNGTDEDLQAAALTLPEPEGAAIQARASCGIADDVLCRQDAAGAPPRGSRTWHLGDIAPGQEQRFEFTMQLLDAEEDSINVRLELSAHGLAEPARSRDITIDVVR